MEKLCDICDFQGGSQPPKEEWSFEKLDGYVRMLQIRDFTQSERAVPEYIKISSSTKLCEEDDILIARYGASLGKILTGLAGAYNVAIMKIIPDTSKVLKRYLYYYLKSNYFQMSILNVGSRAAQAGFNKEDLAKLDINCPSIDEQRKIVDVLDNIEQILLYEKQQLADLDILIKARFVELFGDVSTNPNGYPIKNFDEISILITDGEHATPRRADKGIYLLSARNVLNHMLQLNDVDYIDEDEYNRIARRVVPQAGDVLISCSGSIGRCCVVPDGLKFQMVRSAALIRFNETINPVFVEWLITSDDLQQQIAQSATQSSQANLFQGKIRKLYGYVPPIELQNQFASFVEQTDKSKVAVQKALDEAQLLFDSLMQKYFG